MPHDNPYVERVPLSDEEQERIYCEAIRAQIAAHEATMPDIYGPGRVSNFFRGPTVIFTRG